MPIDLAQLPKWLFAFAAAVVAPVLFYALIWPANQVQLGPLGLIGRAEGAISEIPAGAVVAFDIRDKCPNKWDAFDAANGRFLIGAGKGDGLVNRPFGEQGGSESHAITLNEMPPHTHQYVDWGAGAGSCSFSGCNGSGGDHERTTASAGGNGQGRADAFSIIPPYMAIRFCKKAA